MSSSPSSSSDRVRPTQSKSLTPQRKHRKLLKDGSGSEVWPESIEKIFVQGLQEYWDSPWATYSQSRGRSRWRNQFLVDYLQKAGITRTKKQVASHIQVLRNMWKGEPEFQLVAGGDELYSDSGNLLPVKTEDPYDANALLSLDYDDGDSPSPNSNSPSFSPSDFPSEFAPSPQQPLYSIDSHSANTLQGAISVDSHTGRFSSAPPLAFPASPPNRGSLNGVLRGPTSLRQSPLRDTHFPATAVPPPSQFTASSHNLRKPGFVPVPGTALSNSSPTNATIAQSHHAYHKVMSLCLLAEGMMPFTVNLEALLPMAQISSRPAALALKIRLNITPADDVRSPPDLLGFLGSVSLTNPWASAKCITKVFLGGNVSSEETGSLGISSVEAGIVVATLPDSPLLRCRWFDANVSTMITQELIVDGVTLVLIIYELDRRSMSGMPSAQLLGYHNHTPEEKPRPTRAESYPTAFSNYSQISSSPPIPCVRRGAQTSLSCNLPSATNLRHTAPTSMSF